MPWTVYLLPQAETEIQALPTAERLAVLNAAKKLEALGPELGYPHSSAVRDAYQLRELRPECVAGVLPADRRCLRGGGSRP
jgi:hypothetical protein